MSKAGQMIVYLSRACALWASERAVRGNGASFISLTVDHIRGAYTRLPHSIPDHQHNCTESHQFNFWIYNQSVGQHEYSEENQMKRAIRYFTFENRLGLARIEELLHDDETISTYITFRPHDERFPWREQHCPDGASEALRVIFLASDQLEDPYSFKYWTAYTEEEGYDIDDFWRDRQKA